MIAPTQMNALLFALLSGAASVPPPLPRLRGTSTSDVNEGDVNEGTSPDIIERAPTQRPTRRPTPRPLLFLSSPKSRNCPDDKYRDADHDRPRAAAAECYERDGFALSRWPR